MLPLEQSGDRVYQSIQLTYIFILGLFVSAAIFPFIHFAGCNETVVLVMLIAVGGLSSTTLGGFMVNHIDLACNFSGNIK